MPTVVAAITATAATPDDAEFAERTDDLALHAMLVQLQGRRTYDCVWLP